MSASFESAKELREVIDAVFSMMDADPEMGPKLRDADTPQRFEFSDFDVVVNIRAASDDEEGNLYWEWSDDVDWKLEGPDDDVVGGRQPLLPGQGERRRWRSRAGGSRRAAT